MTNEERADDLLHHIILSWNNHHHQRDDTVKIILAYADEIRRECAKEIRAKVDGKNSPDGQPEFGIYMRGVCDAVEEACAAIMGKEARE